jgi:transposase
MRDACFRLEVDNNLCENAIRPFAMGRKAWLFSDTPAGAEASARFYSLIETALCRARHNAVYAARRTMPNGFGGARRCCVAAVGLADGGNLPFGKVRSLRAPQGRRASDRSAGTGFAYRVRTA